MANDGFIEILSPSALKDLQTANNEVLTLIKNIDNAGKSMQNIKTPSGSDSAIKQLTIAYNEQSKTIQNLQNRLTELARSKQAIVVQSSNLTKATNTQTKATRESAVANQILRAETDRQFRANTLLGGAYAKASAQLLILKKQAKDYAIALGESHPKTLQAVEDANNLGNRIKSADAVVGDFQRNVGNYSNGVVGGFQAIYAKARILANILPGIGIAGIFGLALDPLMEYVKGLDLFKEKITTIKLEQETLNKAYADSSVQEAVKNVSELAIEIDLAKKGMISKEGVVKQYNETIGKTTGLVTNLDQAEQQLTKNGESYVKMMLYKAAANLALEEAAKSALEAEKTRQKKLEEFEKWYETKLKDRGGASQSIYAKEQTFEDYEKQRKDFEKSLRLRKQHEIQINEEAKNKNLDIARKFLQNASKISTDLNFNFFDDTKAKKATKTQEEKTQADVNSLKAMEQMISKLKEQQSATDVTSEKFNALGSIISILETTYNGLIESMKPKETLAPMAKGIQDLTDESKLLHDVTKSVTDDLEKQQKQAEENAKTLKKLKDSTDEYIASFSKGFLSSQGLGAFDQFFDGTFQQRLEALKQSGADMTETFALYFESISESAQQAFNKIFELSNQRFENERINLQREKEIAILFAGDSASAREEINRQYDERQREIRNREAKAKKSQALFNIAIDIAQGIVSAIASGNIPLSIAIGAIGAVELALVASQQVPQFYKGTDNAPKGWAYTQEKGAEIITDKNGKLKTTGNNKGAQLTYLEQGDKVYTAEKSALMFDNGLNNILASNGISMPKIQVNTPNIDISGVIRAIENKPTVINQVDQGGFRQLISNGHGIKEITNRRITGQSYGA